MKTILTTFLIIFGSNVAPQAAIINLAPLGTASSSSTGFGGTADKANDGNRNGIFGNGSVFHSAGGTGPGEWYEVDLGSENYLDRVMVFPRTDTQQNSVRDFKIEVFNGSGTSVYSGSFLSTASTQDDPWGTAAMSGVLGQRVRVTLNNPNFSAVNFVTLSEFEIWGDSSAITNNITSLATLSGAPGAFGTSLADGVDGDLGSNYDSITGDRPIYHDGAAAAQGFYRLDYASDMNFDEVQLFNRVVNNTATTTTEYRISILDNAGGVVTSQIVTPDGTNYDSSLNFAGATGRAVLIEETNQAEFLAFSEVRVFGAAAVPEPASVILSLLAVPLFLRRRR